MVRVYLSRVCAFTVPALCHALKSPGCIWVSVDVHYLASLYEGVSRGISQGCPLVLKHTVGAEDEWIRLLVELFAYFGKGAVGNAATLRQETSSLLFDMGINLLRRVIYKMMLGVYLTSNRAVGAFRLSEESNSSALAFFCSCLKGVTTRRTRHG